MKQNKLTEYEYLEWTRILLENATNQPDVANALTLVGYTPEVMAKGKHLHENTFLIFENNKVEDDQTREARKAYNEKLDEVENFYRPLRTKSKVIFRNNSEVQLQLMINGSFPKSYPTLIERTEKFFNTLNTDSELLAQLSRLAVTQDNITKGIELIVELKGLRAKYQVERGESQEATKAKDKALKELEDWIIDFKEIAELALENQPQLQESLGIFVRS